LLPSLREKKRYIAFEIVSEGQIKDISAVSRQIKDNSLNFFGELGLANAGLMVVEDCWNRDAQRGIIRVNNKYMNHAKASLALISAIDGKEALVRSLGASGTLKKAKDKYMAA